MSKVALFLTCVCLSFFSAHSQTAQLQKQLSEIDSLGQHAQFEKVQHRLDSIIAKLGNKKNEQYFFLEAFRLKAHYYEVNNEDEKSVKTALQLLADEDISILYPEITTKALLSLALVYEKSDDEKACKGALDRAFAIITKRGLEQILSYYYVRLGSYYRFLPNKDSAIYYAQKSLAKSKELGSAESNIDAHMLLAILLGKENWQESIAHYLNIINYFSKKQKFIDVAAMYNNISKVYLENKQLQNALRYSDSALLTEKAHGLPISSYSNRQRALILESMGDLRGALDYFKKYDAAHSTEDEENRQVEIKRISDYYELEKKEEIIAKKSREIRKQWLYVALSIFAMLVAGLMYLFVMRTNRQLKERAQKIRAQKATIIDNLKQKEILLSELQHRVKNNLQLIISLLELQLDAHNDKTIEEITRDTQRRIEGIALLHQKLLLDEETHLINVKVLFEEIGSLVVQSYAYAGQDVLFHPHSDISALSMDIATPLMLILVELISNSFKHGFAKNAKGNIYITLKESSAQDFQRELIYQDDGMGFKNPEKMKGGIGREIINGLIGQMKGKLIMHQPDQGVQLSILF